MMRGPHVAFAVSVAALLASASARAADETGAAAPELSATITASWYAMRDEPDFGVVVAALDRGRFRLEARYNYELRHAASAFVGWTFSGGDGLTWQLRPIAGVLFADGGAAIPGLEASIAYKTLDVYIEAEYVASFENRSDNYFYAWSEIGWRPLEWLRVGLVGQRTRVVDTDRDLQRGIFAQLVFPQASIAVYAFNPDAGSRYTVVSIAATF